MRKEIAISTLLTLAAAQSYQDGLYARDADLIEAREAYDSGSLDDFDLFGRDAEAEIDNILGGVDNALASRDLHDQELANLNALLRRELSSQDIAALEARDPFIGKIFKGVKNVLGFRDLHARDLEVLGQGINELNARDLESLEARDPFIGKLFKGVKNVLGFRDLHTRDLEILGQGINELDARDLELLEARDPFIGKIFKGVKNVLGFRDLQARDPIIAFAPTAHAYRGKPKTPLPSILARDLDNLETRDPLIWKGLNPPKWSGMPKPGLLATREADPFLPLLTKLIKPAINTISTIAGNRKQRREIDDPEIFAY